MLKFHAEFQARFVGETTGCVQVALMAGSSSFATPCYARFLLVAVQWFRVYCWLLAMITRLLLTLFCYFDFSLAFILVYVFMSGNSISDLFRAAGPADVPVRMVSQIMGITFADVIFPRPLTIKC